MLSPACEAGSVTVGSVLQLHDEVVDDGHDVTAFARASQKVRDHQHSGVFVSEVADPAGDESGFPTAAFSRQEQNRLRSRKGIYSEKQKGKWQARMFTKNGKERRHFPSKRGDALA